MKYPASCRLLRASCLLPFFLLPAYCLLPTVLWCPRRDSNPEPTDYESAALTVELQGHKDLLFKAGDIVRRSVRIAKRPGKRVVSCLSEWHGRPAHDSRARCACRN